MLNSQILNILFNFRETDAKQASCFVSFLNTEHTFEYVMFE